LLAPLPIRALLASHSCEAGSLGAPLDIKSVNCYAPEISSNSTHLVNTDFSPDNISNALNNYKNLSISEKDGKTNNLKKINSNLIFLYLISPSLRIAHP